MLPHEQNDLLYLLRILQNISKIILFTKDIEDAYTFFDNNNQMCYDATMMSMINIGENISK